MGFIIALFVCVGAHVFVLLFHMVALPVQVRKRFISVLFRIDWTPVNRPTWHRRLPAWQPEAIQAEKQALEAKSSKDSSVSDKLDILITSVSYPKEDYKEFKVRLALLEAWVERSSDGAKTQADEYSHEDFENEIEDSEEDANQLDSESFNDSFDAGVIADYVGPAIDKGIGHGSTRDYCYHLIVLAPETR